MCRKEAGWNYFNINRGSKLARIHKAGCHTAALQWQSKVQMQGRRETIKMNEG